MKRTVIALLLAVPLLGAPPCSAGVKEDLQGIRKELNEKNKLLDKTRKTETKVSGELEKIQRALHEKETSLNLLGKQLGAVESGIDKTHGEIDHVSSDTEKKRAQINKRLAALYKSGDAGSLRVFFSSESFPQMTENMRYMRGVLENDKKLFQQYNENLDRLRQLKSSLEKDAAKKESLKRTMEARKREVEQEKARKASYLVKVRQDKQSYLASIKELQANAQRLQIMFQRIEARNRKLAQERKVVEERHRKSLEGKNRKGYSATAPGTAQGKKGTPGSAPREDIVASPVPDKGLGGQKGRLSLPVSGKVTAQFGRHKHPEFNSFTVSNGISIAASPGTPIRSIYDGEVIYADYFKGYGNMVIVDHGGGFFSLYAHAASIAKRVGAKVSKNDVVASVGDTDSAQGSQLYFEIRYQGKPVDPSPWFR
ncbi:peptidoglycan DD-metalloendopeptidase family protein [Geomonas sp. RF6]|uniref:murein hydrolase activator EnvC family protein n=1 Tax=Geomonas sp. RF6 TaxID=2897342 RepID=UPI001E5EB1E7|nr:peptidoglycan DD-metalloendopeptidase family protein [Geomonas sp. RF6]UFS70864.1 peptidoglycan DD-metalloendopeptidase family protein [Geomonas sp. RF6]